MDARLKARLWSAIISVFKNSQGWETREGPATYFFWKAVFDDFLGRPIDELDYRTDPNWKLLRGIYHDGNWAFSYDLVQFLADFQKLLGGDNWISDLRSAGEQFQLQVNEVLEVEKSAYRFVSGELVEITAEEEIREIEEAISDGSRMAGAKEHLATALTLFGDRKKADYRNAIKEAISAVESAFNSLNGEKSQNLPRAIKKAEGAGLKIHPALKSGISSIYGWTSDESGIRHALSDEGSAVSEKEAKLMIVLCAAFINYLKISEEA